MRCKPAVVLVLLLAGCRPPADEGFRRLAVPVFQNLTGDRNLDWWGLALAELLAAAATGSPRTHPIRLETWWDAPAARATHVLHASLLERGSQLRLEAVLEDLRRGRMERSVVIEAPVEAGPAACADRLAAALGLRARPVAAFKTEAVRAFAQAFGSADPAGLLETAIAADPAFAPPYLQLVRWRLSRGDRSGAEAVLAMARRAGLDPVERSRLDLMESGLRGDVGAYGRALDALARLTPADPEVWQALALRSLAARDYSRAAQSYREALARDPRNPLLLNQTAYALAYAGDFSQAVQFLLRYRDLLSSDPNPPDSLGDIYFQMGNFARAATYYRESAENSPDFAASGSLFKEAWAHWLRGDRRAADQRMADYLGRREAARDPLIELRKGQWEYLTGRSRQARERVRQLAMAAPSGELRALASGFLAAWSLEQGDREQARRHALAGGGGASPQARDLARICLFLSRPPASPEQWASLAGQEFARPEEAGLRRTALAYALLMDGRVRDALPVLGELLTNSPPSPWETLPVLLAWAATESGEDPTRWLRRWPIPDPGMPQPFDFLTWPRVLYLQALVHQRRGDNEQARALFRLFLETAGDRPGHDRERQQAAARTGA